MAHASPIAGPQQLTCLRDFRPGMPGRHVRPSAAHETPHLQTSTIRRIVLATVLAASLPMLLELPCQASIPLESDTSAAQKARAAAQLGGEETRS
jgi:hypothetical protein